MTNASQASRPLELHERGVSAARGGACRVPEVGARRRHRSKGMVLVVAVEDHGAGESERPHGVIVEEVREAVAADEHAAAGDDAEQGWGVANELWVMAEEVGDVVHGGELMK